MYTYNYK